MIIPSLPYRVEHNIKTIMTFNRAKTWVNQICKGVRWGQNAPSIRMNTLLRLRLVGKCKKYFCDASSTIKYLIDVRIDLVIKLFFYIIRYLKINIAGGGGGVNPPLGQKDPLVYYRTLRLNDILSLRQ